MTKRFLFASYIMILLFFSIFAHSHLNWKEDLLLFILMSLYAGDRIFRKIIPGLNHYLLPFLVIFLLSQFYLNHFHPGNIGWWFGSIPGWLTVLIIPAAFFFLVSCQRSRLGQPSTQPSEQTFLHLIHQAAPGIILVSLIMLFLLLLNFDEISPQEKLVPDHSIYPIIALGFVLFYSLQDVSLNLKSDPLFLKAASLVVLIFLIGMGTIKIYLVYTNYHLALQIKSEEKLWRDLMELNKVSRINHINGRAFAELGKINREKGNLKQAAVYYEKCLTYQGFDFEANLALAELAYQQKEWGKACEAYKRSLYLKPEKRELYFPFVHSCGKGGQVDEAMKWIGHLGKNDPIPTEKIE